MKSKIINIKDVAGNDIVSRDHGKKLRKMIELYWKSADKIIIDFSGLSIASPSYIDEAFAKLLLKIPLEEVKEKLNFINMTEFDRALLNKLVKARKRERDLLMATSKGRSHLTSKQRK